MCPSREPLPDSALPCALHNRTPYTLELADRYIDTGNFSLEVPPTSVDRVSTSTFGVYKSTVQWGNWWVMGRGYSVGLSFLAHLPRDRTVPIAIVSPLTCI